MKKTVKHIILLLLLSGLPGSLLLAQTPELNEEKYWTYRERLRQEFMIGIGPDMGMSIPASVRDTVSGVIQWTDCTMDLGEYIGVLAMEYRILDNRSYDTEQTIMELFYALYALNRLDYAAEPFFGGTASLNGFFIRDDISEDSLDLALVLEHLNQGLPEPRITGLDSDYMDEIPRNNEESLDQAILLITGLALVRKCVPEEVAFVLDDEVQLFQDFESSISIEAANIILRLVNYMKEGDSTTVQLNPADPNLYGLQGLDWDFLIKNPVTMQEVLRGANAYFLSKGFTSAKFHATGADSPTTDTTYSMVADSIFRSFENNIVGNDQDFKVINLNAMASYWPEGMQQDTSFADYNARNLGPRSLMQGYEWIPMLHQLLFSVDNNYLMSQVPPDTAFYNDPGGYYENLLNMAPPEGPYNYNNGLYPGWEWSSTSRTIQPGRRGELNTAFTGNYNGLDYMLYYNMHILLFDGPLAIDQETPGQHVHAYPNPFYNDLSIPAMPGNASWELAGMDGKIWLSGQAHDSLRTFINTASLPGGMYILRIIGSEGLVSNQKLIKQFK